MQLFGSAFGGWSMEAHEADFWTAVATAPRLCSWHARYTSFLRFSTTIVLILCRSVVVMDNLYEENIVLVLSELLHWQQ